MVEAQMAPMSGRGGDQGNSLFVPHLKLPNGKLFPDPGRIDFIDNQVDPDTGTIAIRAVFDNPQGLLLPGQYVTVLLSRSAARRLPVIPQAAVVEDRNGRYVFVVDDQNTVRMRRIETGHAIRNHWVVENGLTAGETIIVQGIQKVTPDQKVNVQTAAETPKE
jgi:membrane fusion protein (multidrug efflux system)